MKRFFRRKKGFTLIELMIVIAIIAILAAILIPNFIRARGQSQFAACESNLKNIATSLEMYSTDYNGNYPSTTAQFSGLTPNYMRTIPVCPVNSEAYTYYGSDNPASYIISQTSDVHKGFEGSAVTASNVTNGAGACKAFPCYASDGGLATGK